MTELVSPGAALAQAAKSMVGTKFRLYGREPESGLDCVGLLHASLIMIGRASHAPEGYGLRNSHPEKWFEYADRTGLVKSSGDFHQGDVVLTNPGPSQQHLMILLDSDTCVHAHAALRRIVCQPLPIPFVPIVHWRLG